MMTIPQDLTPMPVATAAVWVAVVAIGTVLIWRGRKAVAQTTLWAAWCWALASWGAVAAASLAGLLAGGRIETGDWRQSFAMAAAMTTVCPAMALAGAKRPQHVAWQWIVFSLWVVLSLPAIEWQLFAAMPSVHPARRWFLLVLIVPGIVNYLPSRHWLAVLFFGAGQVALLAAYLPGGSQAWGQKPLVPLILILIALADVSRPTPPAIRA